MNEEQFSAGAVWHGPWHTGLAVGMFGSFDKRHWAMALGNHVLKGNISNQGKPFFPFTSQKHRKAVLILKPGTAPFGDERRTSFLIPVRLVVRKADLKNRFKFSARIPDELYQQAVHNYKKILLARKKNK